MFGLKHEALAVYESPAGHCADDEGSTNLGCVYPSRQKATQLLEQ